MDSGPMQRWIGPYRLVETSALSDGDLAELELGLSMQRQLAWRWAWGGVAALAALALPYLFGVASEAWDALAGVMSLAILVCTPLKVRDARKQGRLLRSEVQANRIDRFECGDPAEAEPWIRQALRGWRGTEPPESVTVAGGSGRVLRLDDLPGQRTWCLEPREVAEPPLRNHVGLWPRRVVLPAGRGNSVTARPMSEPERRELEGIVRRQFGRRLWWTVPLALYAAFGSFSHFFGPMSGSWDSVPFGFVFLALSITIAFFGAKAFALRGRLLRDLKSGEVWSLDGDQVGVRLSSGEVRVEVLACSGVLWTVGGTAAGWRRQ